MQYFEFRKYFVSSGCFYVDQVLAVMPDFDCKKLEYWRRCGQIVKLRQNFYALLECVEQPNSALYLSNFIYQPSYVSLQSAFEFHKMTPLGTIGKITAISTIKTTAFRNDIGIFTYQKIKPNLMFGYEQHHFGSSGNRSISVAKPEKALLDMFYSYPPNTEEEINNLQLDEDFVRNKINLNILLQMARLYDSKVLLQRIDMFIKVYGI